MAMGPTPRQSALWHPFGNMSALAEKQFRVDRADGLWVFDSAGRGYLDATASLWCVNAGHGRARIREAIDAQLAQLDSFSIFGDYSNRPAAELAERIADLAPMVDPKVLFGSGGGDGIDTAARLTRQYFAAVGEPNRTHIISRSSGYHGTHGWGTTLAGIDANRAGNGPLIPDASQISRDDPQALQTEIERLGPDRVAAFFCEPVVGSGGVYPPPDGYLESVAEICSRFGVLLVVDSVICAFGRVGSWFGIERWGISPDMIVFAKGVSNGTLPLGGVVVDETIAQPFWAAGGNVFRHGATYSGHPVCCAAALANLELMDDEGLVERGALLEKPMLDRLRSLADHPAVAEVRGGVGALGAIDIHPDLLLESPGAVGRAFVAARDAGVLLRPLLTSLAVSPPLTIGDSELDTMTDGIRAGFDSLLR